jgi:hypothetical protein
MRTQNLESLLIDSISFWDVVLIGVGAELHLLGPEQCVMHRKSTTDNVGIARLNARLPERHT